MLEFDSVVGWYDPSIAYCVNGDGNRADYESLYGMYGENEIVEMVCIACYDELHK